VLPKHLGGLGLYLYDPKVGVKTPGKPGNIVAWWSQASFGTEGGIKIHERIELSSGILCPPPHVKEAMGLIAKFATDRMVPINDQIDIPLLAAQFAHRCPPEMDETLEIRKDPFDGWKKRALLWASKRAEIFRVDQRHLVPEVLGVGTVLRDLLPTMELNIVSGHFLVTEC